MADFHINTKTADSRNVEIFIHFPIPPVENVAGQYLSAEITYRQAIVATLPKDEQGNKIYTSVPDLLSDGELTKLESGELLEYRKSFRLSNVDLTNAQRLDEIKSGNDNEAGVIKMMADITTPGSNLYNELIASLEWWGYYENV